jgi:hypothetical protein
MRKLIAGFTLVSLLFFAACGNSPESNVDSTETAASVISEKPGFTPFNVVTIHRHTRNFSKWMETFNAGDSSRKADGLTVLSIGRQLDDTNIVFVGMRVEETSRLKSSISSMIDAEKKNAEAGTPEASLIKVIRYDSSKARFKQRAIVTYHVKDFDRWLSFYDEKGTATREPYGLLDLGLARDVSDSNTVHIQFAISDVEKAKARLSSSELKKLLADAGVDSEITVRFYKVIQ